jgi:hypothetical protein
VPRVRTAITSSCSNFCRPNDPHGSASFEQERREGEAAELVGPGIRPSIRNPAIATESDVCGAGNIQ